MACLQDKVQKVTGRCVEGLWTVISPDLSFCNWRSGCTGNLGKARNYGRDPYCRAAAAARIWKCLPRVSYRTCCRGQPYLKSRSFAGLAVHADVSARRLDDELHHRKSEPRTFASSLRREERLENPITSGEIHSNARCRVSPARPVLIRAQPLRLPSLSRS